MNGEAHKAWDEYVQRKRTERLSEAVQVWSALVAGGVDAETVLAIDFVHFGPSQARVENLRGELAENCTVTTESGSDGYWLLKGTTRPYGVTLSADDHLAWVDFMCQVASSHGCVLSTWSLNAPSLDLIVSSEDFDGGS
ncbi:hypothetical protein [Lysobacter sp. A3-1-A15]|uniref:hypothetical protein n=1 Tax=Novilysobacter viscosus TaxID=3098602 RepID=UPI002EDA6246